MHTKEPWSVDFRPDQSPNIWIKAEGDRGGCCSIEPSDDEDGRGECLTDIEHANAARIVACVNFCEGVDTDELERGGYQVVADLLKRQVDEIAALKAQRAELAKLIFAEQLGTWNDESYYGEKFCEGFNAGIRAALEHLK